MHLFHIVGHLLGDHTPFNMVIAADTLEEAEAKALDLALSGVFPCSASYSVVDHEAFMAQV